MSGVLHDIRAYFQRAAQPSPCNAEKPDSGGALGWLCTLPAGHEGAHIAHDLDGSLITRWSA